MRPTFDDNNDDDDNDDRGGCKLWSPLWEPPVTEGMTDPIRGKNFGPILCRDAPSLNFFLLTDVPF